MNDPQSAVSASEAAPAASSGPLIKVEIEELPPYELALMQSCEDPNQYTC
jgi:hypothetical protein